MWKLVLQNLSKEASATAKSATRIDILGIGAFNVSSDYADSVYAKAGVRPLLCS